ncbi:hypothetical protein [Chryseobacterium sp. MFBS3-17]|uniref:hypothetical protein n=1 Tax=Chryseobacterium sp. MFBS3-17 TaxID=2886689 RepID=UPI001D0E063E|nr:hypothetical protein [Chryseobacterium sp. MFBS3-17]MCC2589854.1 hypothetical protein [Chryseobacterium sp. MFBS3-17]
MKNILKIFLTAGLAFTMASCTSTGGTYGNNYPGTVYRSPDGKIYRHGEVYRDRYGNVYQNGRLIKRAPVYSKNYKKMPPGQAKKVYGGSARDYAPGQNKKVRVGNTTFYGKNQKKSNHQKYNKWEHDKKKGHQHSKHKNHKKK